MDISTSDRTASDIFRLILDKGPQTLYSASTKSRFPIGTVHRHFKEMEQSGKIKVYNGKKETRKKKPYGPTVEGFVFFYGRDRTISSKLENYFLVWLDHKEFLDELQKSGFDVNKTISQPQKSKVLFRKYVEYFSGVEQQLELLQSGQNTIPHEVSLFIGEALLAMKPKYMKIWEDLYVNLPGIRQNVDDYLKNTITLYKQLQKKHKRH